MRLAAKVLFPGTGWVAFKELMDLVGLMMDLFGKKFLPAFSKIDFEDTLSQRLVFVIIRAALCCG